MSEAIAMAPVLREHDLAWLEEPVRGNGLRDLEELHRATGLSLATGENTYRAHGFRELAASPAVVVLQPDVAKTGGITECLAICALAAAYGKAVLPHLYGGAVAFAATLQLAALSDVVTGVEYDVRDNPLRDPLLCDPPTPSGSELALPDAPGLGVQLDVDAVSSVTAEQA